MLVALRRIGLLATVAAIAGIVMTVLAKTLGVPDSWHHAVVIAGVLFATLTAQHLTRKRPTATEPGTRG